MVSIRDRLLFLGNPTYGHKITYLRNYAKSLQRWSLHTALGNDKQHWRHCQTLRQTSPTQTLWNVMI